MSTKDDDLDFPPEEPTPVLDLPYYDTLREVLAPYRPASDDKEADEYFSSAEIIAAIEEHHGVPQGAQQGKAEGWIKPEDFVRAMHYLGFRAKNTGGLLLQWLLKKK